MKRLALVLLVACDGGERLAATHNGRAAAVARELEAMRELESSMCRCDRLDCLGRAQNAMKGWWDGLPGRLGPPALDAIELSTAEAIGRSAEVCFQRILTQSFLRAAEKHRLEMCGGGDLDGILDEMRTFSDDFEALPGTPWPRLLGDERDRAYASVNHFAACAEAVAPGVQARLPRLFRTWVDPTEPEQGPTVIRGG